eukprot:10320769-Lingulodinium_polyedra.AAC.1
MCIRDRPVWWDDLNEPSAAGTETPTGHDPARARPVQPRRSNASGTRATTRVDGTANGGVNTMATSTLH